MMSFTDLKLFALCGELFMGSRIDGKTAVRIAALEDHMQLVCNGPLAPMVDVSRDPRWGRVMEGAGEDPFLGSKIAEARINGFWASKSLVDNSFIAACAKHFAGYGFAESGKDYNNAIVGNDSINEYYSASI